MFEEHSAAPTGWKLRSRNRQFDSFWSGGPWRRGRSNYVRHWTQEPGPDEHALGLLAHLLRM